MTELKTLKDVSLVDKYGEYALKEVAREWVLDLREAIEDLSGDYTDEEDCEKEAQIEWIENFFNLEDNDK